MLEHLPAIQIVTPLLSVPACLLIRHQKLSWLVAIIANVIALLISLWLVIQIKEVNVIYYAMGGWLPPTGIEYYIDIVNASMLLIVCTVSTLTLIYSYSCTSNQIPAEKHYLFYIAWMLCLTGLLGIIITGDIFNMFVFLEISSLSTYMLVSLGQHRNALIASFRYLVIGSIGASFFLIGIGFLYAQTGTLNIDDMADRLGHIGESRTVMVGLVFISLGLMIKAAIFPLHTWLPSAYQFAPCAASAFLAGTATKVSLYVLFRVYFNLFDYNEALVKSLMHYILLPASVIGFVLMSVTAIFQVDLKRMLAFSSIAQIGYIVTALCMSTLPGLTAGIVHIFNHALVKSALFMAVGCILYKTGTTRITKLRYLIARMPVTVTAFIVSGASLIGVPLTAGFISKFSLASAAVEKGWWFVVALVMFSSLMAIIYIFRAAEVMLFDKPDTPVAADRQYDEAPLSMLIPMWLMIATSLYFGINGSQTLEIAASAASKLLSGEL